MVEREGGGKRLETRKEQEERRDERFESKLGQNQIEIYLKRIVIIPNRIDVESTMLIICRESCRDQV